MSVSHETLAKRLWTANELFKTAFVLKRLQLRRAFPGISDEDLTRRLGAWLRERPGAEHGDGVGRVIPWPRR
ncbi:MAG: hypothetical protein GEV06_04735 [Luteitalea sp.]|nr:hypothetical protein [Luteitalea sp.]